MFKYSSKMIERDLELEKDFGISGLQIYAYRYDDALEVVGSIKSSKIKGRFSLALVAYDKNGDIVLTEENNGYGSGIVTGEISSKIFFDDFPFSFSCWESQVPKISKLKIYPVGD
ncbi:MULTISPECIES: hypothetical protein [Lactobacillus]|uniref:hypothetical protein n=1 Tax=Lactobacillus TaxID=1578 RepID=UPI0026017198|nr:MULTISPECIES: hypothetical protein [Lactobacillus]